MSMKKKSVQESTSSFESNPFKVVFRGLDDLFKYNRLPAIVLLILGFISAVSQFTSYRTSPSNQVSPDADPAINGNIPSAGVILAFLFLLAMVFMMAIMINGVLDYIAWKTSKKETTTFTEAIREVMSRFWVIAGVFLHVGIRVLGGLVLFIIPGVRAALRYQLVLFTVFEEDLKGKAALERIKALSDKHLIEIFGMVMAAAVMPPLTAPLQTGGEAVMFRQLKDLHESGARSPRVHWLNYFGFVLLAGLIAIAIALSRVQSS